MDIEKLLPLLGVGLGWLLNNISVTRQANKQAQQNLGTVVAFFIQAYSNLRSVLQAVAVFKEVHNDIAKFEGLRRYITDKHLDDQVPGNIDEALNYLAGSHPLEAVQARQVLLNIRRLRAQTVNAEGSAVNYHVLLSMHEWANRQTFLQIEDLLFRLTLRHSWATWTGYLVNKWQFARNYRKSRLAILAAMHTLEEDSAAAAPDD